VSDVSHDGDGGSGGKKKDAQDDRERDARDNDNNDKDKGQDRSDVRREARDRMQASREQSAAPGTVLEIAEPLLFQEPVELEQQNATDATAGASGENGTINGEPRDTPEAAPDATTGPGAPLAPPGVVLPPSVPGLPPVDGQVTQPGIDPSIAGGIGSTSQVVVNAVSDATVFTSAPDSPQSAESLGLLAIGGPQGAVSVISFDVTGVGGGTVLSALLSFEGAGSAGAPGGGVGVIYGYVAPEGLTANGVPGYDTALNVHGAPAWFDRVEPGGLTSVDVTGSVSGDGTITFVLPGQPDATATMLAIESGVPPQLILTVAMPA
jgi:hypothetical protein